MNVRYIPLMKKTRQNIQRRTAAFIGNLKNET
jgi:hypothetical protein